jgi:hypothetical protein
VSEKLDEQTLKIFDGVELQGRVNVADDFLLNNIRHSIRLGYPQIWPQPMKYERIAIVGGGPSLADTFEDLRELVWDGAKLVTVNGAYRYCIDRGLKPSAQVVLDARENNAKFLYPEVSGCRYYLASQCHPDIWAAVEGREQVGIFHAIGEEEGVAETLDEFYLGSWTKVPGGTTVTMRALSLMRLLGYLRFDLFGVDSCYMGDQGHAYAQPENDKDRRIQFNVHPTDRPDLGRVFTCSPWHLKQLEDFCQLIRVNGQHFRINVHGDGLLAYALQSSADITLTEQALR